MKFVVVDESRVSMFPRWLAGEFHTRLSLLVPIDSTLNPRQTSSALASMQG